ncbi:sigma-70 family RNA polymerase sigma factor [Spirosoma areae]
MVSGYHSNLLGVLIRMVHDQQLAEDLLQDSFLKIWRNIHQYDPAKGRLFTWMYRIVRHVALDYLQTVRQANQRIDEVPLELMGVVMPSYLMPDLAYWVRSNLSHTQGKLIDLVYFQGYTHQEIAKDFGLPLGTVKTRVRRGLHHLRTCMTRSILCP